MHKKTGTSSRNVQICVRVCVRDLFSAGVVVDVAAANRAANSQ